MGRLSKDQLLQRVVASLEEGGRSVLVEDENHPFVLRLEADATFLRIRIYIWNVTHGGGKARAANEYRIQVTGVTVFDTAGVDAAVILGWWEEGGVFAAWDIEKHLGALGASPSLQIVEECLREAALNRIATQRKENDEIAVGVAPIFLGDYIANVRQIHDLASSPADLAGLTALAADLKMADAAVAGATSPERRVVLSRVARRLRDAGFGERVLRAYGHACAMCGIQLRLIDAAHIVPVANVNNDDTSNGLALCALHHRAFDRALLSVDESYRVVLNPERIDSLAAERRQSGLPAFRKQLRALIALPPSAADRPLPENIREGNRIRGWKKFRRVA